MADSGDSESKLGWATAGVWISVVLLLLIIFGQIFGWWESLRNSLSGVMSPSLPGTRTWFAWFGSVFASPMNLFKNVGGVVASVLVAVILLIPDTAVLGGFVADLANGQARYSVTSAFGLLAALLNWIILRFAGRTDPSTRYWFGTDQVPAAAAQAVAAASGLSGAAAATGMFANPDGVVGVGTAPVAGSGMPSVISTIAAAPSPPPPTLLSAITAPTLEQARRNSVVRNAGVAGSDGESIPMSRMTPLGGRRKQTGGASYALNPSSILGIPLGSKAQPAGLAVIVAIAVIYCLDAIMGKRYGSALAFQVIFAIAIVCGYAFSYYTTEGFGPGILWLVPLIVGIVVGGIGYVVMRQTGPQFLPLDPENAGTPTGEYSKCAKAPDNGGAGEYVCDAYLNGQRIGTVSS